jgi:hypothetical protein
MKLDEGFFGLDGYQMTPEDAIQSYCDWILGKQTSDPFFRCVEWGRQRYEWYMIFYPVRTLLLGGALLQKQEYIAEALKYVELFLSEQLPNGAFTSNFRKKPTSDLSKEEFNQILRHGRVNIADNGSNLAAVLHAASIADETRKQKYLAAVKRWFDDWVALWALPEGGYSNGIWDGSKYGTPYTCAMATLSMAFSIYSLLTGDDEYIKKAEECMLYQCSKWLTEEDCRPVYFECDTGAVERTLTDLGNTFYLLEGLCWTHRVSKNSEVRKIIEERLRMWIFGDKGLLTIWNNNWFDFKQLPGKYPISGDINWIWWELAKSNGIIHCFLYYLNNIENHLLLREKVVKGIRFLSNPLMSRMSGVMAEPAEFYGKYALQATGFAGLSIAEAIRKNSVFNLDAR